MIAAAFAGGALWYVPRVLNADRGLLTGTVTSSAVVTLNFSGSGQLARMKVRLGQSVKKGEVLAQEYAPGIYPVLTADKAAIAADRTKIADLRQGQPASSRAVGPQLADDQAQLAADRATLATDQAKLAATQIVAPAAGIVVAENGQPGQVVSASGIRNYASDSQQAATSSQPQFSLLPEGPQPQSHAAGNTAALPVIALRTSASWQVTALVPEGSVGGVHPGQPVAVSVPAARLRDVPGRVGAVLPTPEHTAQGTAYQVVVSITGRGGQAPLNGMAADVRLTS